MKKYTIAYKHDAQSDIPFCAFTYHGEEYVNSWSTISFEAARQTLIEKLKRFNSPVAIPFPEVVEL